MALVALEYLQYYVMLDLSVWFALGSIPNLTVGDTVYTSGCLWIKCGSDRFLHAHFDHVTGIKNSWEITLISLRKFSFFQFTSLEFVFVLILLLILATCVTLKHPRPHW